MGSFPAAVSTLVGVLRRNRFSSEDKIKIAGTKPYNPLKKANPIFPCVVFRSMGDEDDLFTRVVEEEEIVVNDVTIPAIPRPYAIAMINIEA